MTPPAQTPVAERWDQLNRLYLDLHLERLRLLLRALIERQRLHWQDDAAAEYRSLVITDREADRLLDSTVLRGPDGAGPDSESGEGSEELSALAMRIESVARAAVDDGMPPGLEVLAHVFNLDALERELIVLCLAPELAPSFERLFAYAQDDAQRKYATADLAAALFAHGDAQHVRDRLRADAPLRRFLLLQVGSDPTARLGARPLVLDEGVADYLLGAPHLDARIAALARPAPALLLDADQRDRVERLASRLEQTGTRNDWPTVNLVGPVDAGKHALAHAVCARLGLRLVTIDAPRLATSPARAELIKLLDRDALLSRAAVYLTPPVTELAETAAALLTEILDGLNVWVIVGSTSRWQTERDTLVVEVPRPGPSAQREMWSAALHPMPEGLSSDVDVVSQQFDFSARAIVEAAAAARGRSRLAASDGAVAADDLWRACREQAGWQLDHLARRLEPSFGWGDIVLADDVMSQLRELAAQVGSRSRVYEQWGFGDALSRGRGITALFSGPSGTGKTMAAEVLAREMRLELYKVDLAGIVSKYIGETEKNLREVFAAADRSGAVLFFDEADALFGKRSEVKDSHDRYANIEVNYLLQRMEEYRGVAILTTNRRAALDRAFLRRLRFVIEFPFPAVEHRRRIWQSVFPPRTPLGHDLDYAALARLEIAGGSIRNVAVNAAFLAAGSGAPVGMDHVGHALRREFVKLDKHSSEVDDLLRTAS
jgi:hypothetical protein